MKKPMNMKSQNRISPNRGSIVSKRHPTFAQLSWFHVGGSGQVGQYSFVAR